MSNNTKNKFLINDLETTAAILCKQKSKLKIENIKLPKYLDYGQVLVKMIYSGICASQLGEIDGVKGKDKFIPHLLGHEGIGKVIQKGPGVKKVVKGDIVLLHWMPSNGINSKLPKYKWGKKTINAGYVTTFNEHGIISENRITKIPKKEDKFLDYLLLGCTASTAIGSVNKANIQNKEKKILVSGCGAIGIYIIKYLKQLGFKDITGLDIKIKKLNFATKNGCSDIINSKLIKSFKNKYDIIFETTGNAKLISKLFEQMIFNGEMILIGVPKYKTKASFNTLDINLGKKLIGSKGGDFKANRDLKKFFKIVSINNNKNYFTNVIKLKDINKLLSKMRKNLVIGKSIIKFN